MIAIKNVDEFIRESNAIESEFSEIAFKDAKKAFEYAFLMKDCIEEADVIKEVHKRLMNKLCPDIAGKWRNVAVRVAFHFCSVPKKGELVSELNKMKKGFSRLLGGKQGEQKIKEYHVSFERLHPFEDGNGRVGRIIMNVQRLRVGLPVLVIHQGTEQYAYYSWFDNEEDKEEFMRQQLENMGGD